MPNPIDKLEGLDASGIRTLLNDELPSPEFFKEQIKTFLNDNPVGRGDKVDSGSESYALAQFLMRDYGAFLKTSITVADLESYRKQLGLPSPTSTEAIQQLRVGDEEVELGEASYRSIRYWQEHFKTNKSHILEVASVLDSKRTMIGPQESDERPVVMVFGKGYFDDIPLNDLAAKYRVILVSKSVTSLRVALSRLPEEYRRHVSYEVRDISGGVVLKLAEEAARLIQNAGTRREAEDQLGELFQTTKIPVPILEGSRQVDMIISSLQVTQGPSLIAQEASLRLDQKFGPSRERVSRKLSDGYVQMRNQLQDAHTEALRDFSVRSDGIVYYMSDVLRLPVYQAVEDPDKTYYWAQEGSAPSFFKEGQPMHLTKVFDSDPGIQVIHRYDEWDWHKEPPELAEGSRLQPMRIDDLVGEGKDGPPSPYAAYAQVRVKDGITLRIEAISFQKAFQK